MHYNLGIGRGYSVREVIGAVEEVTGKKVPVKEGPRRPGDPPVLVASSTPRSSRSWAGGRGYTDIQAIVETAWRLAQAIIPKDTTTVSSPMKKVSGPPHLPFVTFSMGCQSCCRTA